MFCKILEGYLRYIDYYVVAGLIEAVTVYYYMGVMLFVQYNLNNTTKKQWKNNFNQRQVYWMTIETFCLYFYILSAAVYLTLLSLRGVVGATV